jgi:hypothetical protein
MDFVRLGFEVMKNNLQAEENKIEPVISHKGHSKAAALLGTMAAFSGIPSFSEYMHKVPELYEIACKLYESDIKELTEQMYAIQ